MTTPESDALLAAVLAAPEDDAPRLVYADWLDENGRPERAQFIRLQVERSRLPRFDPHREVLTRLADRLFDRHGADWVAELPRVDGITWAEFDRGFPRAVVARTLGYFERAARRLSAAAPIDTLELRGPEARRLSRAQAQPALRVLRVRHTGLADPPDELFQSPLLSTVHTLELVGLGLENDGLAALARSGRLEHLRELVLDGNSVGTAGLTALAGARGVRNLTRLSIRGDVGRGFSDDPIVRSHAVWAAAQLGRHDLIPPTRDESDPDVLAELEAARARA